MSKKKRSDGPKIKRKKTGPQQNGTGETQQEGKGPIFGLEMAGAGHWSGLQGYTKRRPQLDAAVRPRKRPGKKTPLNEVNG